MEGLPTYKITIDEEYNDGVEPLGVDAIAFTSSPAVMVKGVAFSSQRKLSFTDGKKYRITAPAMIPMEIYRRDEEGEYYVEFTEQEIEVIFKDFMANLENKNLFNLEHDNDKKVPAYILEAWLVDKPREDKAYSTFGIDVPKGTLMVTAQVTDVDYYENLIKDEVTGFSIEGFLGLKLSNQINTNMKLPDGEHTIDGKVYVVVDGEVVEVKEVEMAEEEVVEAEMAEETTEEETKEVEMADEVKEEEKEEMAVDPAMDSEAILAIVAPMLEEKIAEVLQVIADLKNELSESVEDAPAEEVELQLSAHQRFSNIVKFLK
jgi:hypothetical protein